MRRRLALVLLATLAVVRPAASAPTTDDAGRAVTLPDRVERVLAAGPPASVFTYILKPDALVGWVRPLSPREAALVPEAWRAKPALGRLTGRGGTVNLEVMLQAKPDLVLDIGTIAPTYVDLANRVQEQTKIPYLLLDGTFESTIPAIERLGTILGVPDRAAAIAGYARRAFAEVDSLLAEVPAERRPRVYLARGPEALETGLRGSINTEIIERVGAVNVAEGPGQGDIAQVSLEQVLAWNPEVIVTWDRAAYAHVRESPAWRQVAAVQAGRVYLSPSEPFGWIDRPPALNRLLGLRWLGRVLYPDVATTDLRAVTREFYKLFYHVDLDATQLDGLLEGAGG